MTGRKFEKGHTTAEKRKNLGGGFPLLGKRGRYRGLKQGEKPAFPFRDLLGPEKEPRRFREPDFWRGRGKDSSKRGQGGGGRRGCKVTKRKNRGGTKERSALE